MKLPFCDHHILAFLTQFLERQAPLDMALSHYFHTHKSLGARDRREIGDTVYGMTRWRALLDYLAPSSDLGRHLSLYRKLDLSGVRQDRSIPEPIRLGLNEFLFQKLVQAYGLEEARRLAHLLNSPPPITVRANLLKTNREALLSLWKDKFDIASGLEAPQAIHFRKREPLFTLPEFRDGLFEVQDEGSQLVASLVRAQPGDLVLDYCSGSGGKTLAFAPAMGGKGQIFLHDIRLAALEQAKKRLKRAGVQNGQCLPPGHPQLKKLLGKIDWLLADVPCSGSGTLRRNPDRKWAIDAPLLERLQREQRTILQEAAPYLKPGGHLVYATCSLFPEENLAIVDHFLSTPAGASFEKISEPLLLLPKEGGRDAFFAITCRKKQQML